MIVVGHSMGGRIAQETARLLPGRVIGIIDVDTLQNADAKMDPEAFLAGFANDFAATCDGFVRSLFGTTADALIIDKIAADRCTGPGQVGAALLRESAELVPPTSVLLSSCSGG